MNMKSNVVDNKMIVFGKVTEITEGTGNAAGKALKVSISGKTWDGSANVDETVVITFWNEKADRARKALKEGQYVMIDVYVKDGNNLYGNDFCFRGMYGQENNGVSTVFMLGYLSRKEQDGKVRFSMPVETYNTEISQNETSWIGINWSSKVRANAEKILVPKDGKMPLVMIEAFAPETTESNGNIYLNSVGLRFEVLR